jgi:hypothetical protein
LGKIVGHDLTVVAHNGIPPVGGLVEWPRFLGFFDENSALFSSIVKMSGYDDKSRSLGIPTDCVTDGRDELLPVIIVKFM